MCVCVFPGEHSGGPACGDGSVPETGRPSSGRTGAFQCWCVFTCLISTSSQLCLFTDCVCVCFQERDELIEWWNTVKGQCERVPLFIWKQACFLYLFMETLHQEEMFHQWLESSFVCFIFFYTNSIILLPVFRLGRVEQDFQFPARGWRYVSISFEMSFLFLTLHSSVNCWWSANFSFCQTA